MKGTLEVARDVTQLQKIIKEEVVVEMGSKSWQCGGDSLGKGRSRRCDSRGHRTHPWLPTRKHTLAERQLRGGGDTALILCPILNPGYNYTHGQDHCPVRKALTHKTCESSSSKSLAGNTFGSHSCCLNKRKKK